MGHHRVATPDLGRVFRGETVLGLSEWQLLERYLDQRDEVAFEALVARHGPMVLGVCRRALVNQTDVDDAFQATFLVLVRRARHLGPRDAIGPWLHGVATRVALRARCEAARRVRVGPIAPDFAVVSEDHSTTNRELGEVLDQELSRLPSKYRHPIVLCYLEGQTHEEAARQLSWPIGTVKGRLSRARELLQSRLVRRGVAPTAGALSLALSPGSSAAIQHELLDRTIKASLKLALGQATAQIVSTSITSLVEGVLTAMFLNSLKWAGVTVLVCGIAFTGVGVLARQDSRTEKAPQPASTSGAAVARPTTPSVAAATNAALPEADHPEAPANLAELERALLKAADAEWQQAFQEYMSTTKGLEDAYQASKRLMAAQQQSTDEANQKLIAVKDHLQRIHGLARAHGNVNANSPVGDLASAKITTYSAEAALLLEQANLKSSDKGKENETHGLPENKGGRGKDVKSQLILAKLDDPIAMRFIDDIPLEEVLKYIKQATTSATFQGIPIYVDPLGLAEAEKSMTSTIRNIDVQGVPLRRTLQLILKQLDLVYFVEDGVLCITAAGSDGKFGPAIHEPSPILEQADKAERGELAPAEMEALIEVFRLRHQIKLLAEGNDEAKSTGGGFDGKFGGAPSSRQVPAHNDTPPKPDAALEKNESEDAKQTRTQLNVLLKEVRELVEVLKAERQAKKATNPN
jgi:RNA polymerase sigma factor (sigma-70 family)